MKPFIIVLIVSFVGSSLYIPQASANELNMPFMPNPGVRVGLSPEFTPAQLKGITIHPENPLIFDFIIYRGDKVFSGAQKQEEYKKLIKYFLASLAVPDQDQWVNLSPYEKDRIIKDDFGKTLMGRDLLAQDYILKQITASLIYPEEGLGKKFWDKIYTKAKQEYGTTNVPVNTFNKVWIIPDNALIYEKGNTAYVLKNHLKVMLEEDYLALQKHMNNDALPHEGGGISSLGSQVIRELVLPALEKEVNTAKNFAMLRQVYSGMLLAAWFKRTLRASLLGQIYADKSKLKGVDQNPKDNEAIYQRYLQAYKKGVFNYIKEDADKYTNQPIPRKYFSGGLESYAHKEIPITHNRILGDSAMAGQMPNEDLALVALNNVLLPKNALKALSSSKKEIRSFLVPTDSIFSEISQHPKGKIYGIDEKVIRRSWVFAHIGSNSRLRKIVYAGGSIAYIFTPDAAMKTQIFQPNPRPVLKPMDSLYFPKDEVMKAFAESSIGVVQGDPHAPFIKDQLAKIRQSRTVREFIENLKNMSEGVKSKYHFSSNDPIILKIDAIIEWVTTGTPPAGALTKDMAMNAGEHSGFNVFPAQFIHEIYVELLANIRNVQIKNQDPQIITLLAHVEDEQRFSIANELKQKLDTRNTPVYFIDKINPNAPTFVWKNLIAIINGQESLDFLRKRVLNMQGPITETTVAIERKAEWTRRLQAFINAPRESEENITKLIIDISREHASDPGHFVIDDIDWSKAQIKNFLLLELNPLKEAIERGAVAAPEKVREALQISFNAEIATPEADRAMTTIKDVQKAEADYLDSAKHIGKGRYSLFYANIAISRAKIFNWVYDALSETNKQKMWEENVHPINMRELKDKIDAWKNDKASLSNPADASSYGGIDMNAGNLAMVIKRDGKGVPLPLDRQDMALLGNIEGLEPIILSIKPASETPLFSHLQSNP